MALHKATLQYRVPYAETDQMGVVYYAHYLVYFERVRGALLRDIGLPYDELERRGFALHVIEAHVEYKKPARYEDDLQISGWLAWAQGVRCRVDCEVRRDGILLAEGHTVHACIDRASGRPRRILSEFAPFCARDSAIP